MHHQNLGSNSFGGDKIEADVSGRCRRFVETDRTAD